MKRTFALIYFLNTFFMFFLSLSVFEVFATTITNIDALKNDLTPMEGNIIVIQKNLYGINKGLDQGVKPGELWTIYEEGIPVKDPKTGLELGKKSTPIGYLTVTRPDKQFSEVEITCKGKCDIKSGMIAKRFTDIPAIFYDTTNSDNDLYHQLRGILPNLSWRSREIVTDPTKLKVPKDVLSFVSKPNGVTIWSGGEIIGFYEFKSTEPEKKSTSTVTKETRYNYVSVPGIVSNVNQPPSAIPGMKTPGIRQQILVSSFRPVGSIDQLVYSLEIFELEKGKSPHFVYFYENVLYVQSVNTQKRYTYDYKGFGEVISISTGPLGVIALNILDKKEGFKSKILQFTGTGFVEILSSEPYVFCFFDLDSDGEKETLLGQNYDPADIYGPGVWKFKIIDKSLKKLEKFPVPSIFQLNGAIVYDLDRNGVLDVGFYIPARKFVIYQGNSVRWESPESLGGSIKSLTYDESPGMQASKIGRIIFWSQPAIINFKEINFIAIAANEESIWNLVGASPKRGGVGFVTPYAGGYRFHQLGTQFEGPVQSVFVYKDELYIVVVEGNFFTKRGRTHVIAVPLEDIFDEIIQ